MAYASLTHVQARNPVRIYTATSKPSTGDVTTFIDDAAGEIDMVLQARDYQLPVPITATVALTYLRKVNTVGALLSVEQAAPSSKEDAQKNLQAQWDSMMKDIREGNVELPGVARQADQAYARSSRISDIYEDIDVRFPEDMVF